MQNIKTLKAQRNGPLAESKSLILRLHIKNNTIMYTAVIEYYDYVDSNMESL